MCSGALPIGLTDCLNFGSPERPAVMQQIAVAIDGIAAACKALDVPVVSGNVSLYNETDGKAILPTPGIAAVGLLPDEKAITTSWFKAAGDVILLLGAAPAGSRGISASEWLAMHGKNAFADDPPKIDLAAEKALQTLMLGADRRRLLEERARRVRRRPRRGAVRIVHVVTKWTFGRHRRARRSGPRRGRRRRSARREGRARSSARRRRASWSASRRARCKMYKQGRPGRASRPTSWA